MTVPKADSVASELMLGIQLIGTMMLGFFGSFFALIGTQGMHGDESFFTVAPEIALAETIVFGVASAICLLGLMTRRNGVRLYLHGVAGFAAGGCLAGIVMTMALLQRWSVEVYYVLWVSDLWLPVTVGYLAIRRASRVAAVPSEDGEAPAPSDPPETAKT